MLCDSIRFVSTPPNPFGPPPGGPGAPPPGGRGAAPLGGPSPYGGQAPAGGGQSPFGPAAGGGGLPGGAPITPSTPSSTAPAGPPTVLLIVAGVIAAVGIVVGAVFWGNWIAGIGWLLAGPVAIGVVAVFIAKDTARRAEPIYLRPGWITAAYAVVMVLVAAGVIVGALGFAFWMGRR